MSTEKVADLPLKTGQILKFRDFRLLWLAQVISEFGNTLTSFALYILINNLTGSTAALAGLGIVLLIPSLVFGLVAGVYVDRLDRKQIMIVSDLLRAGLVLGFCFIGSAGQIWLLYLLAFGQAAIGTLFSPAQGALLPNLLPKAGLVAANSLMMSSRFLAGMLGTVTAGVLIGLAKSEWPAFVLDAMTFLVAPLLVSFIRTEGRSQKASTSRSIRTIWPELKAGMRVIFLSRIMVGLLVAVGVARLGAQSYDVLVRSFMLNDLKMSDALIGLVLGFGSVMGIVGSSAGGIIVRHIRATRVVSGGLVVLGLVAATLYFTNSPWYMAINVALIYFASMPINVAIAVLVQTLIPDEVRGRVGAAFNTMISVTSLLSLAGAGLLAEVIGVRWVFAITGIITIISGLASAWVFEGSPKSKGREMEQAYDTGN